MVDFEFNEENGEITLPFMHGGKFAFKADVDLKEFLKELHKTLYDLDFKDYVPGENVNTKHFKPKGEEPQAGDLKRTADMYETKFIWLDKGKGEFEIEVHWSARKNSEHFGDEAHVTFKLNMVNRFMTNKEITQGNTKKVLQSGTWEHRNKLIYENEVVKNKMKKFEKIPFLSTHFLMKTYAKIFYKSLIERDIELMERKVANKLWSVINKHFSY